MEDEDSRIRTVIKRRSQKDIFVSYGMRFILLFSGSWPVQWETKPRHIPPTLPARSHTFCTQSRRRECFPVLPLSKSGRRKFLRLQTANLRQQ